MRIQIQAVESSMLSHLAYDPEEQRLFAQFTPSGTWYLYEGVPERHFQDVIESASVGKAFVVFIKSGSFAYHKVVVVRPEGEPDIIAGWAIPSEVPPIKVGPEEKHKTIQSAVDEAQE